jgi:hypothetical protein
MNINALSEGKGGGTKSEDRFGSPLWLTEHLQKYFGRFTHDLASEPWSAVAPVFITKQMNLLTQGGGALLVGHGYGNYPYGRGELKRFMPFVREQVIAGHFRQVTNLVPHYTADGWFTSVLKPAGKVLGGEWRFDWLGHPRLSNWVRAVSERLIVDVITIKGRLSHRYPPRYTGKRSIAPFSSAIVRFVHPGDA